MWPFGKRARFVRASRAGVVTLVQTGIVEIEGKRYAGLRCTHVQPGQTVAKGQVIGRKH